MKSIPRSLRYGVMLGMLVAVAFLAAGPYKTAPTMHRPMTMQPAGATTPTPTPTTFPTVFTMQSIADSGGQMTLVTKAPVGSYGVMTWPDPGAAYASYVGFPVTCTLTYP